MNFTLISILIANLLSSVISLSGILLVKLTQVKRRQTLLYFVAFAGGTLMGSAFFHLIPEALESLEIIVLNKMVILAFLLFFLFERLLGWHHHHEPHGDEHTLGTMNLLADGLHNFLDGVIIASAFITDINLGFITSFAVIMHEVPQEIGDFAVLLHSGFTVRKALLSNLFIGSTALVGGLIGYYALEFAIGLTPYVTAIAAGGFIYIAAADLLPELRKHQTSNSWWANYLIFVLGIMLMFFIQD
jgi:zinc and cadmium transporter